MNSSRDIVHGQCNRAMHSNEHSAGAGYSMIALAGKPCTCSVHCQITHRCTVHVECTLHGHRTCAVHAVSALNGAKCAVRVQFTMHMCAQLHIEHAVYALSALNGVKFKCISECSLKQCTFQLICILSRDSGAQCTGFCALCKGRVYCE